MNPKMRETSSFFFFILLLLDAIPYYPAALDTARLHSKTFEPIF